MHMAFIDVRTWMATAALLLAACGDDGTPGDGSGDTTDGSGSGTMSTTDSTTTSTTAGTTGTTTASTTASTGTDTGDGSSGTDADSSATAGESSSGSDTTAGGSSSSETTASESSSESSSEGGGAGCPCDPGEYCDYPDDQCGDGQAGVCMIEPDICPEIYMPVCGCDGMTYGNECEAHGMGQDVAYAGECEGGQNDCLDCTNTEYCAQDPGVCNLDVGGTCTEMPDACIALYDPVCGCDGMTYSNSCVAASFGQNVSYAGQCQ